MKTSTHIKLSISLHTQLKELAKVRSTTMTGLISEMIHQAVEAGEISGDIPGYELTAEPGWVTLGSRHPLKLRPAYARDFADNLILVLDKANRTSVSLIEDGIAVVCRQGSGMAIETQSVDSTIRSIVTCEAARVLAHRLHQVANEAEQ